MNRDLNLRLDAPHIALPRQDQALNHWAIRIYKYRCFRKSDFHASLNRQKVESLRTIKSIFLQDFNKLASNGSKKDDISLKSINEYRNKESSQTTLEAETDEARSKDLKMHVTKNNEISSKEKKNHKPGTSSRPTNKTKDVKTLQQMEWTGIEPAPRCGTHRLVESRPGT